MLEKTFKIEIGHENLKCLIIQPKPSRRPCTWVKKLQKFDFGQSMHYMKSKDFFVKYALFQCPLVNHRNTMMEDIKSIMSLKTHGLRNLMKMCENDVS